MRRVTIVGGGIGGLALAAALDPRRFDVTVIEAQPERAGSGAALGLWPAARRALRRIGAHPAYEGVAPSRVADAALHDLSGRRLVSMGGPDLTLVPRARLLAALDAAVPRSVRRETREVTRPEDLDADLVVGADGVRSRVRGLVWPRGSDRVETPYIALRGMCGPVSEGLSYGEYWGAPGLFGILPVGDDSAYWFTAHRSELGPEPLDPAEVVAEARARFAGGAGLIRRTLDTRGQDALATRLWLAPPLPRYAAGRYVVIGDAAHASLPNLGRGACDALVDAASLAESLSAGMPLALWQARRLPLTQGARTAASTVMRLALLDRGGALRDAVLGVVGQVR